MKLYIILAAFAAITITACDNEEEPKVEPDTYTPTITFLEPEDESVLTNGDELHMEIDFAYPGNTIHHVGIYVINESANDTVFEYEEHANTIDFYNLHEHLITSVTEDTEFMVEAWSTNADESIKVSDHVHVMVNL